MLRKDDPQFKKLIDDTVATAQTSGEAEKWFDKWFKNPIPPKDVYKRQLRLQSQGVLQRLTL